MLLFIIILFVLILIVYIFYRLGLLNVLQIFFLGLLCILTSIIIFLMLCPTTIKDYLFFQGNFQTLLQNIPNEIINQAKIDALSGVNSPNTGQILSNLTNNVIDILSQKPVDNSIHLENQTKLLTSIDNKISDSNVLKEVQLAQYQQGQSLALQKLDILDNTLNGQTKKLTLAINNPTGVLDKLTNINSHVKPAIQMLGELNEINYKLSQEKQILSEGFSKLLQSDGNNVLGTELQNIANNMDKKFALHQESISQALQTLNDQANIERAENKKLLEQMQLSSLADIEIAHAEAEKRINVAEQMVNYYKKHEDLGSSNYNSGVNLPKTDSNSVNQAAAGLSLATAVSWALKFLRII